MPYYVLMWKHIKPINPEAVLMSLPPEAAWD